MYSSSSRAPSLAAPSITSVRPDVMLEVKCKCDRSRKKKITFSSARNCSLFLLQTRVEQCFALRSSSYSIQYQDDDGEVVDIGTENDLTEAIHYFHAPDPDGVSSRDSMSMHSMSMRDSMSIRSLTRRKITIYVDIVLEYDGPSLSDASSTGGSDRDDRFSLNSDVLDEMIMNPYPNGRMREPEWDERTVSSRQTQSGPASSINGRRLPTIPSATPSLANSRPGSSPSESPSADDDERSRGGPAADDGDDEDAASDTGPFERMRSLETLQRNQSDVDVGRPLNHLEWIRRQQELTPAAIMNKRLRTSRSSGALSSGRNSLASGHSSARDESVGGRLALQQNDRGKYYYAYTSSDPAASVVASSNRASSIADDSLLDELSLYMANQNDTGGDSNRYSTSTRSSSAPLNDHRLSTSTGISGVPMNDHRLSTSSGGSGMLMNDHRLSSSTGGGGLNRHDSIKSGNTSLMAQQSINGHDMVHFNIAPDIPPEVLKFVTQDDPAVPTPPDLVTDCSSCGVLLDNFRYVCTTCGEKKPMGSVAGSSFSGSHSGTGSRTLTPQPSMLHLQTSSLNNNDDEQPTATSGDFAYPPTQHRSPSIASVNSNGSTLADPFGQYPKPVHGPAVTVPGLLLPTSPTSVMPSPQTPTVANGYELCLSCMEGAGVLHAMESTTASGVSYGSAYPSSPLSMSSSSSSLDDTMSERRRAAPSRKGQIRHAFVEKVWGVDGWKDIEQDSVDACSICNTSLAMKRYKCSSCQNFNLCRACYSQVHEIHPAHAFLVVPERPTRTMSEPIIKLKQPRESMMSMTSIMSEDDSLRHPDVKCAHCTQDIIGARFHCAICDDVDICANCESAGLPGNMTSIDGGHNYKHIMIKIPYPLNSKEVQSASQHALNLWTRRDSRHLSSLSRRSKARSEHSSHARTVVGTPNMNNAPPLPDNASDRVRLANEANFRQNRLSTSTSGSRNSAPMSIVSGTASEHGGRNGASFGPLDHRTKCKNCRQPIVGVRYQCATCPSSPTAYSLCAQCEPKSYFLHDPQHIFFKLPRPVERPIKSPFPFIPYLYRQPAGSFPDGTQDPENPRAYLRHLVHPTALCDFCMERINGEWYRCAYCGKDLCGSCEAMDTHDPTHLFVVFKSAIDMSQLSNFSDLERPAPLIPYKVY